MTFNDFLELQNYTPENTPCDEYRQMQAAFEYGQMSIANAFAQKFGLTFTTGELLQFVKEITNC